MKEGIQINTRLDKKTKTALQNAAERARDFQQRCQRRYETQLWKEANIPCSLYDAISRLTKAEMDEIRKNYGFKNLSALKKDDLAAELARLVPSKIKQFIYTLDQSRYDLVKTIVGNAGAISAIDVSAAKARALQEYSIAFPGVYDDQRVLFIPHELITIFSQLDHDELQHVVTRNGEWIQLVHGLLHYFGVMDAWLIKEKIKELTGQGVDFLEFFNVMSFACDFYKQASYSSFGYQSAILFDAEKVIKEQRLRPGVNYYPFSKEQLLKAGTPGYIDKTPELNRLVSFLLKHYKLSDKAANEIVFQITHMINEGLKVASIIQNLQHVLEFPSFEFVQQVAKEIVALNNNTRQWVLKGHTPNELFQEERKSLRVLPTNPFEMPTSNPSPIDLQDFTKVGRNEFCPCGSGKKYKKCCGR